MRKMTKKAVTIAAMSAMTAASASMAFAAEKQETNISSVAKEEEAVNSSAVGEWSGDDVKGWKFTKEDGTKLKDQWAQIDGVWYYFKGETIAQDRFLTLDNKGYFFDEHGRLATGWQKINSGMDAYSDIEVPDRLYNSASNYYVHPNDNYEYDYHDFVYCYFDDSGIAKHNEWFQDSTGLWYYFDGDVMVKNVYNYVVRPDNNDAANSSATRYYGFDEEGAMLVGWNYKELKGSWNDPTTDEKGRIWYYYASDGRMQQAGWKQIDGKWYLFANESADRRWSYPDYKTEGVGTREDDIWIRGGFPLIVNSYVASYNNTKYEYFYVDEDGKMVTGVQKVPKEAYKVLFYTDKKYYDNNLNVLYDVVQTKSDVTVNFGSNGAAKEDIVSNRYYTMEADNIRKIKFETEAVEKINNSLYDAKYAFKWNGGNVFSPTAEQWNFTDGIPVINDDILSVPDEKIPVDEVTANYFIPYTWENLEKMTAKELALTGATGDIYYLLNTTANKTLVEAVSGYKTKLENQKTVVENTKDEYEKAVKGSVNQGITYINGEVKGYNGSVYPADTLWVLEQTEGTTSYVRAVGPNVINVNKEIKKLQTIIDADLKAIAIAEEYMAAGPEKDAELKRLNDDKADAEATQKRLQMVKAYVEDMASVADKDDIDEKYKKYEAAVENYNSLVDDFKTEQDKLYDAGLYKLVGDAYVLARDSYDTVKLENDFIVKGELVKNAFIGRKDDAYFADSNGDFITNKAVLISDDVTLETTTSNLIYQNAYILFGKDGKGIRGYEGTKKSISVGGVTYWATDATVTIGKSKPLTVFISNKTVGGHY